MKRIAAAAAVLVCLVSASGVTAAPESLEAIEKDLSAILSEMDTIRLELDRIGELSSMPKATGVRIETQGAAGAQAPAAARFVVGGKAGDEREFGKAERDAFQNGKSPLVVELPLLPGSYQARIVLSHPRWKVPPSADFAVAVKPGTTALVRFKLSAPARKKPPALSPVGGK